MPEDDTHVSYHRFDSYEFSAKRRRRMHRLGFVNFVLAIVLVVFGIMLIGALVSRAWYHNRFWPYDNNPCTDLHTNCPLLLISMDGFRHNYLENVRARYGPNALPNFNRLERHGVRAMQSVGAYPTMTMPNQHTLVTGLYPESHGIVANNIRDTKWPNVIFEMYNQTSLNEAPWLEGWPEPIWVTLQRTGRRVGSLLWPFTDGTVHGDLPFVQVSQFTLLDDTPTPYPYKKRVTDLLWWLDNPYYQLDLILAYFEEPDKSGHIYGPDSEEVAKLVVELDQRVGQLLDGLEKKGLANKVDIIVTADHGMTRITNVICLDDYVDPELYTHTQLSTLGFLYPNAGKFDEVYAKLQNAHPNMKVYRATELPLELNFNHNSSRMPPLIVIPDAGWCLVHNKSSHYDLGNHGYPMNVTDMNAFFIARGPSFLVNHTVPQIQAMDIYALMSGLLSLSSQPNNGSLVRIANQLLRPDVAHRVITTPAWYPFWWKWIVWQMRVIWFFIGFALWIILFCLLITAIFVQRNYGKQLLGSSTWGEIKA